MRSAVRCFLLLGLASSHLLVSAVSLAERPPTVKALLKRGAKEYRLSNFREALEAYKQALAIESRPSTILNVAQCHRQLGEKERALFYYRLYLTEWERANPDKPSPYREEVEGYVKSLSAALEEEKRAAAEKRSPPREDRRATSQPATIAALPPAPAPPRASTTPMRRPIYKRWWFWTAVGIVAVGAAVGGAVAATRGDGNDLPRYNPGNF